MDMEWIKLAVTLITFVVTITWTVVTWNKQRQTELREKRKILSALYVNPFLMACHDLQSRLYHLLQPDGFKALKNRSSHKDFAAETLYLLAQYFGWANCIYRYGPYSDDQKVIELVGKIRETFGTNKFRTGPFCFLTLEQKSLGQIILQRNTGPVGTEFETIAVKDFQLSVESESFSEETGIAQTLKSLIGARSVDDLGDDVCERIIIVQGLLVDLLEYLEDKEGITLFFSETSETRRKAQPLKLHKAG